MATDVRVLLIDDHALCRRGLAELLERRPGITVAGFTGDPDEASRMVAALAPDLVVLDLRMPDVDGLTLLKRLREEGCKAAVLILTMSDSQDDLARALRAGVRGYVLKNMEPDDLVDAIQRVARGEMVVAPALMLKLANMLDGSQQYQSRESLMVSLTEREREILTHLARGESNKAIARELDISHDTVKLHVRHILSKLNLTSRVEAAIFAVEHRIAP
ncbi:MAG: response regulator [Betaproteobacteria bacterium]|nr:response regulator [Betaproteobacteria bacterium]MBK9607766.1 response regulator [Betaproteobacteria bacterium]